MAISEDDDTVRLSGLVCALLQPEAIATTPPHSHRPGRTLILGWNWRRNCAGCAIGYRLSAQETDEGRGYGVVVNPPKSRTLMFAPRDHVSVLAED